MMHGSDDPFAKRHDAWRMSREAKRAAWRARRAARHASRGEWGHFGDPKFWGLDAESMKHWGFGGAHDAAPSTQPSSEIAELKAKIADMERIISSLSERVIVLEKLAVDDERRLAAEIEKLRGLGG